MKRYFLWLIATLVLVACPNRPDPNHPVPDAGSGGMLATGGSAPVPIAGGPATGGRVATGGTSSVLVWLDCAPEGAKAAPVVKHPLGARMTAPAEGFRLAPPIVLAARSGFWDALNPAPLNQTVGSCVGYSAAECLSTVPFALPSTTQRGDDLYHWATVLDSFVGTWPPTDTGSDCISGAKAAQKLGFIVGFDVAYTIADIKSRLTLGPGILCSNWSTPQFSPDRCGRVHYDPTTIEGGHARAMVGQNVELGLIAERNTWGPKWGTTRKGATGYFSESYDDVARELSDGGVAVFYRVP